MKAVIFHNLCNFELGCQISMNVPIWIFAGFQPRDSQDSHKLNNHNFFRTPVSSAQGRNGTESYPAPGVLLNYDDDYYSRGFGQIKEAFRALAKDDILQPQISDHDFRSSNIRADDVRYNLYVFDIRYRKVFTAAQSIKVEFNFDGVNRNDINGYALVLTIKSVSISSGGQGNFDS